MSGLRPGILAVRAVNQYRRREVLAYLGLRYYLDSSAAVTDHWAQQAATRLLLTRNVQPYFPAIHFKELSDVGPTHRKMLIPGPNEALTEAALLATCSEHLEIFGNPTSVFSYPLAHDQDRSGVFQNYFDGLRSRHIAIAKACDNHPKGVVRYSDITRFYPSIPNELARTTWTRFASSAQLDERHITLGHKILEAHRAASPAGEGGLLTGPMFSHLIGNLVFRDLDIDFSLNLPARYFRYVDDITLVGSPGQVKASLQIIRTRLGDLGFKLHDDLSPKSLEVPTKEWLQGRDDFHDSNHVASWKSLIGSLKQYLLAYPHKKREVQHLFQSEGIQIPILDYSSAAREAGFLLRIKSLGLWNWFRRNFQALTIQDILAEAISLRNRYQDELKAMLDAPHSTGFTKKRLLPKIRYRAGRLTYLATPDAMIPLSKGMRSYPELHFHAAVMHAVATGNLDEIQTLGTNAAQAAAQPLRASGKSCVTTLTATPGVTEQSLAILLCNGVKVKQPKGVEANSDLLRFASNGTDLALMKSNSPFIREIACLHGVSEDPRHPAVLESAFDEDEDLAMDAVEQLQQSASP